MSVKRDGQEAVSYFYCITNILQKLCISVAEKVIKVIYIKWCE